MPSHIGEIAKSRAGRLCGAVGIYVLAGRTIGRGGCDEGTIREQGELESRRFGVHAIGQELAALPKVAIGCRGTVPPTVDGYQRH